MQSAFVLYHRWDNRCGDRALPDLPSHKQWQFRAEDRFLRATSRRVGSHESWRGQRP